VIHAKVEKNAKKAITGNDAYIIHKKMLYRVFMISQLNSPTLTASESPGHRVFALTCIHTLRVVFVKPVSDYAEYPLQCISRRFSSIRQVTAEYAQCHFVLRENYGCPPTKSELFRSQPI
jgi:hypothetical protein